MKTKTTLAALLLAAVMVTPSYAKFFSMLFFSAGADEYVSNPELYDPINKDVMIMFLELDDAEKNYMVGYFRGMVIGVVDAKDCRFPEGTSIEQIMKAVAHYFDLHQDDGEQNIVSIIVKAIKLKWHDENKHVVIPKGSLSDAHAKKMKQIMKPRK